MSTKIFTIFLIVLVAVGFSIFAKDYNLQQVQKVTPADDELFQQRLNNIKNYVSPPSVENANREELGRTWYDYATNNVMGRMIAHAYGSGDNGVHFGFMKIFPQTAQRFVTYDYYNQDIGLFFGNSSVTESRRTGWGRVINGKDDEALISMHSDPVQLWQDNGEAGYSFTSLLDVGPLAVFAGFAVTGDTIVLLTQINNVAGTSWMPGNTVFKYSTDYGQTWNDGANMLPPAGAVEFSNAERWPEFNPTNPQELGIAISISQDASQSAAGWLEYITSTDFGTTWNSTFISHDDSITSSVFGDTTRYIIENFSQMNNMYSSDGTFHIVYGAVQGIRDTLTSADIDYWPILHWDSNSQTFHEVTSLEYSAPDDPAIQVAMADNRPGNGLGNGYPHIAEGPNGELVCIWQQWVKDPATGGIVLLDATTGGGTGTFQVFATDIWGSYSLDGGQTWEDPVYLAGNANESDVYPNITRDVTRDGDSLYLDILIFCTCTTPIPMSHLATLLILPMNQK
jgi:hypothetical protein